MNDSVSISAALRLAAANLASAAAGVGRLLESIAEALEPEDDLPTAPRRATKRRGPSPRKTQSTTKPSPRPRKKSAAAKPSGTRKPSGQRAGRATRERRPSA